MMRKLKIFFILLLLLVPFDVAAQEVTDSAEKSVSPEESAVEVANPESPDAPSLETAVFVLKHVRLQVAVDKARELLGISSGGVIANEQLREMEVTAPKQILERVKVFVDEIDQARDILIDVKVIQVDLNEEHQPGINWSAIVSDYKNFTANEDNRKFSIGTVSVEDVSVLLEALETVGETKVYPVNSVKIPSGKDADFRLKSFDRDVNTTIIPIDSLDGSLGATEKQDRYSARLLLSPSVSGNDMVNFGVKSLDGSTIALNVKKDSVVIIGGIFTQTKSESTKKFPFLGDVPLLGIVFRDQSKVVQRLENILILTPRVSAPLAKP